ncbi:hypothetical protein MGWOODY_Smn1900 [hydrothermal vent metagenome]|uniref:Uncharacterized protein n=1 Tax=hydrothermal vent metagenome TaxID=652676 RepID=A0A170PPC6_9ZZZZ
MRCGVGGGGGSGLDGPGRKRRGQPECACACEKFAPVRLDHDAPVPVCGLAPAYRGN